MLNIPTVLPNEIDRSYLGAVMRQNGDNKESAIIAKIALHVGLGDKTRRQLPAIELLGKIAQTDTQTFVRQHSTLPYRRGITSYFADLRHGSEDNRNILRDSGMRVARPGAYCCHACIEHDLATHGRSYWHREHQIPGLLWCPTHGTPLHYMEHERSFLRAPDQLLDECRLVTEPWLKNTIDNQFIKNFLAISFELLNRERPFDVKHISGILKKEALLRGLHSHCGKVKAPLLSDAIIENFGREWLATVMPTLAYKQQGKLLSQMDGVLYLTTSASSSTAYILALSYLFETPEVALIALTRSDESSFKASRARSTHKIDQHDLKSAYLKAHGSYAKTANLLKTTYSAICGRLSSMKLPNLDDDSWQSMQRFAAAYFVEGKSLSDSVSTGGFAIDVLDIFVRVAGTLISDDFLEMKKPKSGRGSGIRRPLKLAPNEVALAKGPMATKFSPNLRREQRLSLLAV